MIFTRTETRILFLGMSAAVLAACANGGGGGGSGGLPGPGGGGGGGLTPHFLIRSPTERPRAGDNTTPFPNATSGTPNLLGAPQAISGAAFPLVQDAVGTMPQNLEVTELNSINNRGATLTARSDGYQLTIPALGIDVVLPGNGSSVPVSAMNTTLANINGTLSLGVSATTYFGGGFWFYQPSDPTAHSAFSPFIFGYRTPAGTVPQTGSASYNGDEGLLGIVMVPNNSGGINAATLEGDVSLTASFTNARINGAATNIIATDSANRTSNWNSFSIDATIRSGPKDLEGSTLVTSVPGTPFALQSGAVGRIGGYFFGPNLEGIGAVWSLGNSDNSGAAWGIIGTDRGP